VAEAEKKKAGDSGSSSYDAASIKVLGDL